MHYFTNANATTVENVTPTNKNVKNSRFNLLDDYMSYTDKKYINIYLEREPITGGKTMDED